VVVPPRAIPALEIERRPDLDPGDERILEGVGQHRNDALPSAIDGQCLTDGIRTGAEILAPDALADDDSVRSLALIFVSKRLTKDRPHANRPEIIGANSQHGHTFRLCTIGEVCALAVVGVDGRQIEPRAAVAKRQERRQRHVIVGIAGDVIHADEPFGLGIRERPQHDRVQHAEHRHIRPQPERKRGNDDGRESPGGPERPHGVGEVSSEALHSVLLVQWAHATAVLTAGTHRRLTPCGL